MKLQKVANAKEKSTWDTGTAWLAATSGIRLQAASNRREFRLAGTCVTLPCMVPF